MLGTKIEVNGIDLHYEKVGTGSMVILLLPGGIGTTRTAFSQQLDQMSKSSFTLIAWDPPGYGFSRPPERVYKGKDTFYEDADLAAELMRKLGYNLYSLMGWSDGAKTALVMAIKYQARIDKMVIWGGNSYVTPTEHSALAATEDTPGWSPSMKAPYIEVYGAETFQTMWSRHIQFYRTLGDICRSDLNKIRCPTLVLHGNKDPLCPNEHPKCLETHVPDVQVHHFPTGAHNIHQVFTKEFNRVVTDFLNE